MSYLIILSLYLFTLTMHPSPFPFLDIFFFPLPSLTLPCHTLPYFPFPSLYLTIPYDTSPYFTIPYIILPCLTIPCLTILYLTTPYLTIPYLIIPYLTIPYLTMPYHILSYQVPGVDEGWWGAYAQVGEESRIITRRQTHDSEFIYMIMSGVWSPLVVICKSIRQTFHSMLPTNILCYDWVVEPPVHVHEVRLQVATLSGCCRWFNQWLITISAVPGFHLIPS